MAMKSKPPPSYIEIPARRPTGSRFFEYRAKRTIVPCGIRVDSASARGVMLVSLCIDDQEQLKKSLSAELFNEVAISSDLELPPLQEGKMLDLTFTGDILKVGLYYREVESKKRVA